MIHAVYKADEGHLADLIKHFAESEQDEFTGLTAIGYAYNYTALTWNRIANELHSLKADKVPLQYVALEIVFQ